jgi:subtilase family serine protease
LGEIVKQLEEQMHRKLIDAKSSKSRLRNAALLLLGGLAVISVVFPAHGASGQYIANNTPAYVSSATNLGAVDPVQTIEVSIWLQPHNRSGLDALSGNLYNPKSPDYRHWLKSADVRAQFAPTAAEARTVEDFFESNNLKVVRVGPNNFYVRAQGTVGNVESAFHVQLNNYEVGGKILMANASDPYIDGSAAALVQAVSGLDNGVFQHPSVLQPNGLDQSSSLIATQMYPSMAASAADASSFVTTCFPGPKTEKHTTLGTYPKATYQGNSYSSSSSGCGYSPSNIYTAYNLNGLYAEGYNGAGQTIVIVDACGSPTILNDANTFSKKFGLPKLTASNFSIINYPAPSTCAGYFPGINADVEWAHAIAPGANIDLLVPPTGSPEDVDEAIFYAVDYELGNVINGSFYTPEFFVGETEANKENLISEIAAVEGIATNFACGEFVALDLPWPVNVPADLPYATGVGGVSLALNPDNSIAFETAWESHASVPLESGVIYDPSDFPPDSDGFLFGGTGGPSAFFARPWFQKGVPGKYRQEPDISWLADPYTGGVIVATVPEQYPPQIWLVDGGTELATPMFSALWAIANQEAGMPLGQAAPYLYSMTSTTITDIVPYASPNNVTAVVQESSSSSQFFDPVATLRVQEPKFGSKFYSALWDNPSGVEDTAWVLSFGQDYFFKARVGWDEVTGVGAPSDAKAFADWFAPSAKQ